MNGLERAAEHAAAALAESERARERAVAGAREIIRLSKRSMHALHRGKCGDLEPLDRAAAALSAALEGHPEVLHSGVVGDALAEYAEARLLAALIHGGDVPGARSLGIPERAWALGLADCLGELRRVMLTRLMDGDTVAARSVFDTMETVAEIVLGFDVPDAVAPLRRKQDIARGLMERSRSDMAAAVMADRRL